jgi:hypothetical protein
LVNISPALYLDDIGQMSYVLLGLKAYDSFVWGVFKWWVIFGGKHLTAQNKSQIKSRLLRIAVFCMAMAAAFTTLGYGQGVGSIVGTVTDSTGAVIPSASVKIIQTGTGLERTVTVNAQGYFVAPSLRPSQYDVSVSSEGFRSYTQRNVTLGADQTVTVNVKLEVGSTVQSVTVTTDPPQVNTTTGVLSQVVDQQRMIEMPLNGRNAASLTMLVAGAALTTAGGVDQGATKTFPMGVTISINGAKQSQMSYNLDGGNNTDIQTNINQPFPFPDALQEFSVQTSNYSARYGGNAGGVVNVISKSGTNDFHGSAFEFVRNPVFNAHNYFSSSVDTIKRNQFGGTVGGPIKKDKTFIFGGYQHTILNSNSSRAGTVPTKANVGGDFTNLLDPNSPNNPTPGKTTQILDPTTGKPFPINNVIPVGRLDPAAVAFEKMLPQPTTGNGQIRYLQPDAQTFNEYLVRGDHSFTDFDRLTARYFYDKYTDAAQFDPANLLTYQDSANIVSHNAVLSETHVFSSQLLNEANLSWSRVGSLREPPPGAPSMSSFGIKAYDGGLAAIQNVQVAGYFTVGSDPPAGFMRNSYRLNDDLSWIRGRHSLHIGGAIQRDLYDVRNSTNIPGDYRFTATNTKNGAASFLLGQINQLTQGSGQFAVLRNNFYSAYIQDDFHATQRLTLNLGLRYEPFSPWRSLMGLMQFNPVAYNAGTVSTVYTGAPKGMLFPGDPGVPQWGYNGAYNHFTPRFGFAYALTADGKTSVRGGAGMFFDTHTGALNNQTWGSTTPFNTGLTLSQPAGPFSDPYKGITNPFPAPSPAPKNYVFPQPTAAYSYDPMKPYHVALIYNWNLALERQFGSGWLVRAAYVGSHGSHGQEYLHYNPGIYTPGDTRPVDKRRTFPGYGLIGMFEEDIDSSYNALQVSLEKRLQKHFTIMANYTYAKSLDDSPNAQNVIGMNVNLPNVSTIPWNMPGRHQMDFGPSSFDRTQRFVASYVWNLPALTTANPFVRLAAGGWQWSGIVTKQTGDPLTIVAGADISQTALNADRAVQVGSPYGSNACGSTAACVSYLNPTAFQNPATGTFGSTSKGGYRGPGSFNWDMSLSKRFPIYERVQVLFRAEFFNVFNHPSFNDPTVSLSGGLGQITGAQAPRIGQMSLKATF